MARAFAITSNTKATYKRAPDIGFVEFCTGLKHSRKEIEVLKVIRKATFGRGKIILNDYILTSCGFIGPYRTKKIIAFYFLKKHNIPVLLYHERASFYITLSLENFLQFIAILTRTHNMTKLSGNQLARYLKVITAYHDYCYFKNSV